MKNLKAALFYILIILVVGCAAKKKVTEKVEVLKSDTLINKVEIVERPAILNSLIFTEICDSITGKPKEFRQIINVGKDTVIVEVEGNEMRLKYQVAKGLVSKLDSLVQVREATIKELKDNETVRNVTPLWHWILHIVFVLYLLISLKIIKI